MEFDNIKQLTTEETNGCTTVDGGESNNIFCMHCGAAVKKGSAYCSNCGQVIPKATPIGAIQDEHLPKRKRKKWPFFVFGPISLVITLVVILGVVFANAGSIGRQSSGDSSYGTNFNDGSIYDSCLIGTWSIDSVYSEGKMENCYGITATFRKDHSGYLEFEGDRINVEWEYIELDDEGGIVFEMVLDDVYVRIARISGDSEMLFLSVDDETVWILEKD